MEHDYFIVEKYSFLKSFVFITNNPIRITSAPAKKNEIRCHISYVVCFYELFSYQIIFHFHLKPIIAREVIF